MEQLLCLNHRNIDFSSFGTNLPVYPHMGSLKLAAVRFVVRIATPRREHCHDRRVPVEAYLYFVVDSFRLGLGRLSSRFLAGESLCLVRHFAIRKRKDKDRYSTDDQGLWHPP
jgi:hypothetical protein